MTASMTLAETAYISRRLTHSVKQSSRIRLLPVFVAVFVSLAMIFATALPANAERRNDDMLKALAAIAAIAIISKVVKDNKSHKGRTKPVPTQSRRVPAVCAIEIGSGRGSVTGYAERCLREEGFNYQLPIGCATDIRIYGRADRFYPEQCLRDAGFLTREY